MSAYRFLQDHSISGAYYQAGTVASTADVGGTLPANFQPTGACEPLDSAGVAAFYAMGPQLRAFIRQQWTGIPVARPVTLGGEPEPNAAGQSGARIRADWSR